MSEAYKRDLVRGWCEAVSSAPFVDTINDNARPADSVPVWFTVAWGADTVEPIAFCGVRQETGLLNVFIAGAPNVGDQAVSSALDAIAAELMAREDPLGQFTLEGKGAPVEDSAGTADRWYKLMLPIEYRFIIGGP